MTEDDAVVSICQPSAAISGMNRRGRRFRRLAEDAVEQAIIFEKCKMLAREVLERKRNEGAKEAYDSGSNQRAS